jgi:GT2 family glycosyltransferase
MPDVSVIIVTWNSESYIGPCLESIQRHSAVHRPEIIVADNGSEDDTCARISEFPNVRLLRFGANLGFPRANNLAAQEARGKYLFFLNPDTYLNNDAVGLLRAHLEDDGALGAVGPGISTENGESIAVDARTFPSLRGTLFRHFGLRFLFPHHPLFGGEYLSPEKRETAQLVECLTGAAIFLPAELFREINGFDEKLPMYFEDVDLCGKVRSAGKACGFLPEASVTHFGGESTARSPISLFLLALEDGQAPWMYFRKYRTARAASLFIVLLACGNLFRLMLYAIAAPLAIHPVPRGGLIRRTRDSLTLLRWCFSDKRACLQEAQSRFDCEPVTVSVGSNAEGGHGH